MVLAVALGGLASLLVVLALGVLGRGLDAHRLVVAAILLGVAALVGTGAVLVSKPATGPRQWLGLAVVAVIASFVPYPVFVGALGFLLNGALTALAAGALLANVRGERRLAARERDDLS